VDKDELLKLLDLGGHEPAPPAGGPAVTFDHYRPDDSASPTALELDEWALRRGRDLLAESQRLQELGQGEFAVADFHACAFEPEPRLRDDCADRRRREFVAQLLQTPEYHALHTSTMLHAAAAEVAATAFAEQFAELNEGGPKAKDAPDREMETLRAVGRALARASDEVGELREAAAALGLGPARRGPTTPGRSPNSTGGSAANPRYGGSASWPAATAGWPSRGSGASWPTAPTT
jgi:hypothetical protein